MLELGDRMKQYYENVPKTHLVRRMPVIIRLDGVRAHTFTRGFERPFDHIFIEAMDATAEYLCKNIMGAKIAYTQSDEISLLLTDYDKLETDAWFGYEVQKLCSVAASMATYAFNEAFNKAYLNNLAELGEMNDYDFAHDRSRRKGLLFDARCFNLPKEEVCNYFIWREQDAINNSVNMIAQSFFSHKELQNVSNKEKVKMLLECGVDHEKVYSTAERHGRVYRKDSDGVWMLDKEIPVFMAEREFIETWI